MPSLGANSYGKSAIRLVTVVRHGERHDLRDLTVAVRMDGEFGAAHDGDNAAVLPTDTMKNTVYALARAHASSTPEEFGEAIGARLLASAAAARHVSVEIAVQAWERIRIGEHGHDHAFTRAAASRRLARVAQSRDETRYEAGIENLGLLKTADSAFAGFLHDDYTTLRDTHDRIMATDVDAQWKYARAPGSFDFAWRIVRDALVETFAEHESKSVQHTLYAMAATAVERCEELEEIRITMPNRHHLPVDLTPFAQENRNEVFVATDAPYGLIEAVVRR